MIRIASASCLDEKPCYGTVDGKLRDLDYSSWEEGADGMLTPTYAAVTSRSYHNGLVQAGHLDGSVRTYSNSMDLTTWRSLSTRAGGEIIKDTE